MVGVPVIINHKDITDKNADDERVGVVNSVWYDNKDGWYWCDGIIWNETAQNLITDKNWSVSCSYNVKTADNEGGSENNIKYDMEFLDGVFTHLALVNNPRYERANIVLNSKTEFINKGCDDMEIDNARGFDGKEGEWITVHGTHIFIPDGKNADDVIKEKFGNKEDKQETYEDIIAKYDKKYNVDKNDKGESWLDRASEGELKTNIKQLEKSTEVAEDEKKRIKELLNNKEYAEWHNKFKKQIAELDEEIQHNQEELEYTKAHLEKKQTRQSDKQEDKKEKKSLLHETFDKEFFDKYNPEGKELPKDFVEKYSDKKEDKSTSKDLYSDENFEYNANRLNKQFGEKPYSEWQKDVQTLLKKYNKTESDFDKAIGATKKEGKKTNETKSKSGVKETKDEHGRLVLSKEGTNKKVKIHKNGNFYLASYGQELKDDDGYTEFQVFPSASGKSFKTEAGARKWANKMLADNSKEQDMTLLEKIKELISTVENEKGDDMDDKEKKEIDNEKVDKRKLIDEVGGILKGKVDDEIIRTIIGKLEKVAYDESEAGSADNKKVKNEDEDKKDDKEEVKNKKIKNEDKEDEEKVEEVKEDVKEDVDNKCKNSKTDFFDKMNKIYNSAIKPSKDETEYVSRADRLKAAEDYFKV